MQGLTPHTPEWYDRLATLQRGYFYPWKSDIPPHNGEDDYLAALDAALRPDLRVLDVGCGHGEVPLAIASRVRSVVGFDRVTDWVRMAKRGRAARAADNVTFLCVDSSPEANAGVPRLPVPDHSVDLFASRRGPLNWFDDVRRAAAPGASVLMLNPEWAPRPEWAGALPAPMGWGDPDRLLRPTIERLVAAAGLTMLECRTFVVPEVFSDAREFYIRRTFGFSPSEVPPYDEVAADLEWLFSTYGDDDRLTVQRGRLLWSAQALL